MEIAQSDIESMQADPFDEGSDKEPSESENIEDMSEDFDVANVTFKMGCFSSHLFFVCSHLDTVSKSDLVV